MTYDVLLSPTFTGTAPCSPRISEIAASTPPDAVQTEAPVSQDAGASLSIQSSPACSRTPLNSGERDLQVTADYNAGDDAAARNDVLQTVGATVSARCEQFQPPVGFLLIEESLFELMMRRIADYASRADDLAVHSFLANPDFSRAFEQRASE
jgi:hypothetical protein